MGCLVPFNPLEISFIIFPSAGNTEVNARLRAAEAREGIERLGPAYVKVAQAISTRVDLVGPEYLAEIERLQDRVPPFPSAQVCPFVPGCRNVKSLPFVLPGYPFVLCLFIPAVRACVLGVYVGGWRRAKKSPKASLHLLQCCPIVPGCQKASPFPAPGGAHLYQAVRCQKSF